MRGRTLSVVIEASVFLASPSYRFTFRSGIGSRYFSTGASLRSSTMRSNGT